MSCAAGGAGRGRGRGRPTRPTSPVVGKEKSRYILLFKLSSSRTATVDLGLKLLFFHNTFSNEKLFRDSSKSSALSSSLSSKSNSPERPLPTLPRGLSSPTSSPTLPRGPALELERGCGEQAVVSIKALCKD